MKKRIPMAFVLLILKIGKHINTCIKKCCEEKNADLLSIGAEGKRDYVHTTLKLIANKAL